MKEGEKEKKRQTERENESCRGTIGLGESDRGLEPRGRKSTERRFGAVRGKRRGKPGLDVETVSTNQTVPKQNRNTR